MNEFDKLLRQNAVIQGMIDELIAKAKLYKSMLSDPEKQQELEYKTQALQEDLAKLIRIREKFAKKVNSLL